MTPTKEAVERIAAKLRLETPLIAVFDSPDIGAFAPTVEAKGGNCCFAYYPRWLKGETVVIRKSEGDFSNPDRGCPGAQMSFGLKNEYPPFMAHFLTDGVGAPMGEGLKAGPEIAQEFIDTSVAPEPSSDTVLIGPLRVEQWPAVRSVTFFVDPDRLAGVITLAGYRSADREMTVAPFSSGCGMIWRSLGEHDGDRAIVGCTDLAMRKYLPPEILSLTVSPRRFLEMLEVPEGSFLDKDWWNDLMDQRARQRSAK